MGSANAENENTPLKSQKKIKDSLLTKSVEQSKKKKKNNNNNNANVLEDSIAELNTDVQKQNGNSSKKKLKRKLDDLEDSVLVATPTEKKKKKNSNENEALLENNTVKGNELKG